MELLSSLFVYVLAVALAAWRCRTLLNPVSIALGPLMVGIAILWLDPLEYDYREIHVVTAIILVLYAVAMALPYLFSVPSAEAYRFARTTALARYPLRRLYALASILLTIGLIGYALKLHEVVAENGIPISVVYLLNFMQESPHLLETSLRESWSLLHYIGYLGIVYTAYAYALDRTRLTTGKIVTAILCAIYFLSLAGLFIKVQVVIGMLLLLFTYAVLNGRGWRATAVAVVGIGVVVTVVDNYIYSANMRVSTEFLLRYLSGSIVGLDSYLAEESISQSFGANTLSPFYLILENLGVDTGHAVFNRFYVISDWGTQVNTGTILRDPYLDYGAPGVLLFVMCLSIVSRYLMGAFMSRCDLTTTLLYALLLCILFLGFIGGIYTHIEFVSMILLHLIIVATGLLKERDEVILYRVVSEDVRCVSNPCH